MWYAVTGLQGPSQSAKSGNSNLSPEKGWPTGLPHHVRGMSPSLALPVPHDHAHVTRHNIRLWPLAGVGAFWLACGAQARCEHQTLCRGRSCFRCCAPAGVMQNVSSKVKPCTDRSCKSPSAVELWSELFVQSLAALGQAPYQYRARIITV